MRVCGRLLRPSTLAERRLLLGHFGTDTIRVPRSLNPYAVARKVRRLVMNAELTYLYDLTRRTKQHNGPPPLGPDADFPEQGGAEDVVASG